MTRCSIGAFADEEVGARLTIDLGALKANWRLLSHHAGPAQCAAVVKADAYGIGIENAVAALAEAGCSIFFVALPMEAKRVRQVLPEATIYVLGGLPRGAERLLVDWRARPVLNSIAEIEAWASFCRSQTARHPAAIQFDTGMNRLGLSQNEFEQLARSPGLLDAFDLTLAMSHLACADTPDHPLNRRQVERFQALRGRLPDVPASLANSAGTLLGQPYLFDLCRPGIALYGGQTLMDRPNPMRHVVRLEARIAQIRYAERGESVGYGAAETLRRDSRLAVLAAGYGDGYLRAAGSTDSLSGASAFIGDQSVPLVGRVSMDLITVDVTDLPEVCVKTGDYVELLGERFTVDELAERAGTIGYEILTGLGRRYHRIYKDN